MSRGKRKASKAGARSEKEVQSLLGAFLIIRVLHYAAAGPSATKPLHAQLYPNRTSSDLVSTERVLHRLRRHGWLIRRGSLWRLAPKGRQALRAARGDLEKLVWC